MITTTSKHIRFSIVSGVSRFLRCYRMHSLFIVSTLKTHHVHMNMTKTFLFFFNILFPISVKIYNLKRNIIVLVLIYIDLQM